MAFLQDITELYDKVGKLIETSKLDNENKEEEYELSEVYFVAIPSLYNISSDENKCIIGKYNRYGKFEMLETYFLMKDRKNIIPIHELITNKSGEHLESPSDKIHDIVKYNITLKVSVEIKNNETKISSQITNVSSIPEANNIDEQKLKEIIQKYPFLIGFLGIKGVNIPIIVDSDIVLKELKEKCGLVTEPIGDNFIDTISRKISVYEFGKEKYPIIYIPETLGKEKAFFEYSNIPRNMSIFNSQRIVINGYSFINKTKMIVIIIKPISYFISLQNSLAASFINSSFINNYKEEIKFLIESSPIDANLFEKYSNYTLSDLNSMLQMYSLALSIGIESADSNFLMLIHNLDKYTNEKEDLENNIIAFTVMLASYYSYNELQGYEDITKLKQNMLSFLKRTDIEINKVKTTMKNRFNIIESKTNKMIEDLDQKGFINISNEKDKIIFEQQTLDLLK
ncbi:MAG: hypothetical protein QW478_14730 [Candidatus Micrarchaeaceae archaeon]